MIFVSSLTLLQANFYKKVLLPLVWCALYQLLLLQFSVLFFFVL